MKLTKTSRQLKNYFYSGTQSLATRAFNIFNTSSVESHLPQLLLKQLVDVHYLDAKFANMLKHIGSPHMVILTKGTQKLKERSKQATFEPATGSQSTILNLDLKVVRSSLEGAQLRINMWEDVYLLII